MYTAESSVPFAPLLVQLNQKGDSGRAHWEAYEWEHFEMLSQFLNAGSGRSRML
jgi:hypothetical protein